MTPTANQMQRVTEEYSQIAKEAVEVEITDGTLYAFGSELACLRLRNKINAATSRINFSANLHTWYYAHEVNLA